MSLVPIRWWCSRSQREHKLALGRLSISLVALAATYFDRSWGGGHSTAILLFYVLYSLFVLMLAVVARADPLSLTTVWRVLETFPIVVRVLWNRRVSAASLILIHIADLTWAALICLLTGGLKSPFFFLFVFVILAAACRWGAPGALPTAGASMLVLLSATLLTNSPPNAGFHFVIEGLGWGTSLNRAVSLVLLGALAPLLAEGDGTAVLQVSSSQLGSHAQETAGERRRIARDLHDGVIQSLIVLEIELDLLRREKLHVTAETTETLASVQQAIRQEVRKLRELTEQLRSDSPPCLLSSHLSDAVEEFQRETGIATSLQCDVQDELLHPRVAQEIAGIVREALANVPKHSGAQNVQVRLTAHQDHYQLVVKDDGRGFDFSGCLSQQQLECAHKGPRVIRERVHSIQGELAIESYAGRGSRLEVQFDARN